MQAPDGGASLRGDSLTRPSPVRPIAPVGPTPRGGRAVSCTVAGARPRAKSLLAYVLLSCLILSNLDLGDDYKIGVFSISNHHIFGYYVV